MADSENSIDLDRLKWAIVPLRVSAILIIMFSLALIAYAVSLFSDINEMNLDGPDQMYIGALFLSLIPIIGSAVIPEVAIHGLRKKERWGWVLAVVLGAMYCFSFFIFLGVPILTTLLKKDIQSEFLK